jgi:hypothetical protein
MIYGVRGPSGARIDRTIDKGRDYVRRFAILVLALPFLLAVPSAGRANIDPGDGGSPNCSNSGLTGPWDGYQTVSTQKCLSHQTAFEAWEPNWAPNCQVAGYEAEVYWLRSDSDWVPRLDTYFCNDGLWHWSAAWGYNEWRVSQMTIANAGVYWIIDQY